MLPLPPGGEPEGSAREAPRVYKCVYIYIYIYMYIFD